MALHLYCRPVVVTREGGDHVGVDAYLRCPVCKKRTVAHVECWRPTDDVLRALRREWRRDITMEPIP